MSFLEKTQIAKSQSQRHFRFENLLGLIGGGGGAYSTDTDEKSKKEEEVDPRFVITTGGGEIFSSLFLLAAEMTKRW